MSKNIWIGIGTIFFCYIRRSIENIGAIFAGYTTPTRSTQYHITDEIVSIGPRSFAKKPTAIKLGRALFVPFILIAHLYNNDTEDQK